ncbi:MAG: hypothetical protein R2764_02410 [Bacteroidales bacterium]
MHKAILVFCMLITGVKVFAMTIDSTNRENKNTPIEEFNGISCRFCPKAYLEVSLFRDANPVDGFGIAFARCIYDSN